MLIDIALDAVGSDKAPEPEIRGAILACRTLPVRVHLVGPEAELRDLLDEHLENDDLPIVIHHASERIGMDEKAMQADRARLAKACCSPSRYALDGAPLPAAATEPCCEVC